MKALELYRELRHHRKLAEKRNLNLSQNKVARAIIYVCSAVMLLYLMFIAIMFALIVNESDDIGAVEFICGISPFILTIDFLFRFWAQQTPSQIIKPYTLLPISRYSCINNFIATSLFTYGNLIWFAMLLPYTLMSVIFGYGIITTILFLIFFWLIILANSQWYSIIRTLINDSIFYWIIPICIYAIAFSNLFFGKNAGINNLLESYAVIGTLITEQSMIPVITALSVLFVLIFINRHIQYSHIIKELSNTEKTKKHKIRNFSFLEKYGDCGLYIQLEIKSIIRNKNPRKSFIFASLIIIVLSCIISFTDIYDYTYMDNFWCIYNFIIYGAMMLLKIMCNEGNYFDCLMVRHENILSLLRAKYLFYTAMLLFPLILMLPIVFTGKWSIMMLISYAVFTAGFQYFILFQMAIYNKQTIPLNTKFLSKGGLENNYFQIVAEMINFIIPMALISVLQLFVDKNVSYIILFMIGLPFIATHQIWLRNIYKRFMKRRYINMEAFRATR